MIYQKGGLLMSAGARIAGTLLALMVVFFPFHSAAAQLTCYLSSSPECRYVAACSKLASPYNETVCACEWQFVIIAFPESQLLLAVEMIEALAAKDETRMLLIAARSGSKSEFMNRVVAVGNATHAKCFPKR